MKPIFQTQNTALAVTLATCGVPFPTDERGHPVPFVHFYDAPTLRRLGYQGWAPLDAARDAARTGKRGNVVYNFERTDRLDDVIRIWDKHSLSIKEADSAGRAAILTIPVDPQMVALICCQCLKNRSMMLEGWKTASPYYVVHGPTRQESATVTVGSYKLISVNASADLREKISL